MVFSLFCSTTRDIEKVTYILIWQPKTSQKFTIPEILENTYLFSSSDRDTVWSANLSINERQVMKMKLAFLYHLLRLRV